ncbi:pyrimidine dimer DNA glycosylase/endonuclease V [Candidatus Electronema sp. TJ]|uniref:pyrimidine dimer DNA glycosylase/endonuclease V n=1 Tax=Candidatus Electronema sp. TJ TaxID=3401573 RepID=UPI003AA823B9
MRIWDISPGYLNRQSLLGEHRELHGIVSILTHGKKGYSRHPETLRWTGCLQALARRHQQLTCEMALRGFRERSPIPFSSGGTAWPAVYIDEPAAQFVRLKEKYAERGQGRIPLPRNAQQLWSQHKYSTLAREVQLYKKTGQQVASGKADFVQLAQLLAELLRQPPTAGGLKNALQHMWGHVAELPPAPEEKPETWSWLRLLKETQLRAMQHNEPYLTVSTALSDLMMWTEEILPDQPTASRCA